MSIPLQPTEILQNVGEIDELLDEKGSCTTKVGIDNNSTADVSKDTEKTVLDPLEEDVPYTKTLTIRDIHETSPFKQAVKGFVINKLTKKVGSSHILSGLTEKIVKKLDDNRDSALLGTIHTSESDFNLRTKESSFNVMSTSISCELKSVVSEISLPEVSSVEYAKDCLEEFNLPKDIPSREMGLRSNSISLPSSPAHKYGQRASSISNSLETLKNQLQYSHTSLLFEDQKMSNSEDDQTDEIELKKIPASVTKDEDKDCSGTIYLDNAYYGKELETSPSETSFLIKIFSIILLLKNFITSVSLTHLLLLFSIVVHNVEIPSCLKLVFDTTIVGYTFYSYICVLVQKPAPNPTLNFPFVDANLENASILVSKTKNVVKGCVRILKSEYDPEMVKNHPTELVDVCIENSCLTVLFPKKKDEPLKYNLLGATVFLVPKDLPKKRIWNKKYPICIALPPPKSLKDPDSSSNHNLDSEYVSTLSEKTKQRAVYLFTLTDREKESLFWVLQKNIQLSIDVTCSEGQLQSSRFENTASKKDISPISFVSLHESKSEESLSVNKNDDDSWAVLDRSSFQLEFEDYMRILFDKFEKRCKYSPRSRSFEDLSNVKDDLSKSQLSLMSKDDSFLSSLTCNQPVDWLNLILGRVFFDFLTQKQWSDEVKARIQKKLDKIEMPTFIESLVVTDVYLGSDLPQIHSVSNPVMDTNGVWFNFDFNYCGTFQMTLTTKLKMAKGKPFPTSDSVDESAGIPSDESSEDEGTSSKVIPDKKKNLINRIEKWVSHRHFQAVAQSRFVKKYVGDISNMPLTLTVELNTLHGILTLNIPPAPTDRIWYGFRKDPVLSLNAYPRVGTREINLSAVVKMIEKKLIQEFKKALVMPNMDDLLIPIMYSPVYNL